MGMDHLEALMRGLRQGGTAWSGLPPLLLLVALEEDGGSHQDGVPCRVLGTLTTRMLPAVPATPAETPASRITRLLTGLGMPTNLLGFMYLRQALLLTTADPALLRGLMHGVYPQVAEAFGATAHSVERAIRHAIAQAWLRGGAQAWGQLLGRGASTVGERPTNGEFLSQLTEAINASA